MESPQISCYKNRLQEQLEKVRISLNVVDDNLQKFVARESNVGNGFNSRTGPPRRQDNFEQTRIKWRTNRDNNDFKNDLRHNLMKRRAQYQNEDSENIPIKRRYETGPKVLQCSIKGPPRIDEEDYEEEEELPNKPTVLSCVVAKPIIIPSRKDAASVKTNKETRARDKRMFGALLGTLQQFCKEESQLKEKEDKKARVEKKLEENAKKEKEKVKQERFRLIRARKERAAYMQAVEKHLQQVKEQEEWEELQQPLFQYIRTECSPPIYYLPKTHCKETEQRLADSQKKLTEQIENNRNELKRSVDNILERWHLESIDEIVPHEPERSVPDPVPVILPVVDTEDSHQKSSKPNPVEPEAETDYVETRIKLKKEKCTEPTDTATKNTEPTLQHLPLPNSITIKVEKEEDEKKKERKERIAKHIELLKSSQIKTDGKIDSNNLSTSSVPEDNSNAMETLANFTIIDRRMPIEHLGGDDLGNVDKVDDVCMDLDKSTNKEDIVETKALSTIDATDENEPTIEPNETDFLNVVSNVANHKAEEKVEESLKQKISKSSRWDRVTADGSVSQHSEKEVDKDESQLKIKDISAKDESQMKIKGLSDNDESQLKIEDVCDNDESQLKIKGTSVKDEIQLKIKGVSVKDEIQLKIKDVGDTEHDETKTSHQSDASKDEHVKIEGKHHNEKVDKICETKKKNEVPSDERIVEKSGEKEKKKVRNSRSISDEKSDKIHSKDKNRKTDRTIGKKSASEEKLRTEYRDKDKKSEDYQRKDRKPDRKYHDRPNERSRKTDEDKKVERHRSDDKILKDKKVLTGERRSDRYRRSRSGDSRRTSDNKRKELLDKRDGRRDRDKGKTVDKSKVSLMRSSRHNRKGSSSSGSSSSDSGSSSDSRSSKSSSSNSSRSGSSSTNSGSSSSSSRSSSVSTVKCKT